LAGRWRFSPAESSGHALAYAMGKAPHKGDGTECPPSSSGAARLTGASRKPGGTVGIGSRARRDGAKRPLYSDRIENRNLVDALCCDAYLQFAD